MMSYFYIMERMGTYYVPSSLPDGGTSQTSDSTVWSGLPSGATVGKVAVYNSRLVSVG